MDSSTGLKLPQGFATVQQVLDGEIKMGDKVSVLGLVTDLRAPIPTKGADWKCQIQFYDHSVQDDEYSSLKIDIFRPESDMPQASCGDVIVILKAKVQKYQSAYPSLCTHQSTVIHVFDASKIPKPPTNALGALRPSKATASGKVPDQAVNELVPVLHHSINKSRLPSESHFESMKTVSCNVANKSCELKDVCSGKFADVVAQVVKEPYDLDDKICLWISDYTENSSFFHFSYTGNDSSATSAGSCTAGLDTSKKGDWAGPFGKRSMQVTCFDPHASAIRNGGLSKGCWVLLRNLQIKTGHNGVNLEGYLRGDRVHEGKINVTRLNPTEDPEGNSPLLSNAIRRKLSYEKSKNSQLKHISAAAQAGQKRRADMGQDGDGKKQKMSKSKAKRKRKRQELGISLEPASVTPLDLNAQVKCENESRALSRVAEILKPIHHETTIDGELVKLQLPFINANYRCNVRVVDFMPPCLENFACPRKVVEFEALSDYEPDSDLEAGLDGETVWEWCFFLELEDAAVGPGQQKQRFWVVVDNQAGQCLTRMDASDLQSSPEDVDTLRERLFTLWGELEERKAQAAKQAAPKANDRPADSDDEKPEAAAEAPTVNRPFACCVRQYGAKTAEKDPRKADAGKEKRWQRMFGLFGTQLALV